jgi:hypothetical protein
MLDPVAEYLGAAALGDECRGNNARWEVLIDDAAAAPSFQTALRLIRSVASVEES